MTMITMKRIKPGLQRPAQQGIVLIEALIAVLIFSLGILGVVGLQAAMIKSTAEARYRAEASYFAQQRIGTIWVDQENITEYEEADTDIAAISRLPNGKRTTSRGALGNAVCDLTCFTVIVSWQQPGSPEAHRVTLVSRVAGG